MPRTLPAALTTVMDAGIYEPYLRVVMNEDANDTGAVTVEPLAFKLEPLQAYVKIAGNFSVDPSFFRIVRGAVINGTPSTISSIWFKFSDYKYDGKFLEFFGKALAKDYQSIAANSSYQTVIETALVDGAAGVSITPNYEGAAVWKAYQFYPTGKAIILSPRMKLFTLLQQKYLIFATEDGWDGAQNNMFFFAATTTRTTDYTVVDQLFNHNTKGEIRKLISRDESNTIHSNGDATSVIHNLGFLHSTAALPTNATNQQAGSRSSKLPVHLKYRTGDQVDITLDNNINPLPMRVKVTEILNLESTPAWYQVLETLEWFSDTEGGPLPSTIEAAAPYTPLATGNFDAVLSTNDNNIQAAMETIDDHAHTLVTEDVQDIIGAMVTGNTETGITVTYQDSDGTIDFELTTAVPTTEEIQDIVGAMVSGGTETGIAVTYDDTNARLDFVAEVTQAELDAHTALITTDHGHILDTQSANNAFAANTTFATLTGLSVSLVSGKEYEFEYNLDIDASAAGGCKFRCSGSFTYSAFVARYLGINNTTLAICIAARTTTDTTAVNQVGATDVQLRITGRIECNGSGTFFLQAAQQVASGTSTVKNTVLKIWEI